MSNYEIIPGRGKVKKSNTVFGCGIGFSNGSSHSEKPASNYDRTKAQIEATGNKWAIENFNATHN